MGQLAISAFGLSKQYRIPAAKLDGAGSRILDAIADLTFKVEAGEAVGLIGRNGAGKSTLLKVLSRVTRPSSGHADVYGRVGALLEVGTGFHPDLTGRENTFLSGAILGMSTRDINARFDDIVAFSEIAQFIDMPVKHYSSGMYARLGFAVAAFLKPDILIVDEILAVGDLNFQAKCLAHMRRLAQDGTTVLFVSHNLLAMADLCPRAMVMADGRLFFDGPTPMAIGAYRRTLIASTAQVGVDGLRPTHELRINGRADAVVETAPNSALSVELEIDQSVDAAPIGVVLNLTIEAGDGRPAVHLRNDLDGTPLSLGPGRNGLMVEIEDLSLAPGAYTLSLRVVALDSANPSIWETDRIELLVLGDSRLTSILQPRHRFAQRG